MNLNQRINDAAQYIKARITATPTIGLILGSGLGDPAISQLGKTLGDFHTVYYTGHCTGTAQYDQLKGILGDRLQAFSTGTVLEL